MIIVNIINSNVGKLGSIGFRAEKILSHACRILNKENVCICRKFSLKLNIKTYTQGFSRLLINFLNFYRIYFNNRFQFRNYDIKYFDHFALKCLKKVQLGNSKLPKVVHIWEPCIETIKYAKSSGFSVILDIPIAPAMHSVNLDKIGLLGSHNLDLLELVSREKKCYRYVDHFISPSQFVCDVLKMYDIPQKKISLIPFGVDSQKFQFDREYTKGSVRFCFAGAINRRKGIKFLLEAFDDSIFENDELHLCGRVFKDQRKLIEKVKLKNLVLPGIVNTAEYFRSCDVYVFPTLMEGSSKSIFEAMASGMPVITTCFSGSLVRNGKDGFIVPAGNSKLLREKMIELKCNLLMRKKMGKSSQSLVSSYTWDKYAGNVVQLYDKLAGG